MLFYFILFITKVGHLYSQIPHTLLTVLIFSTACLVCSYQLRQDPDILGKIPELKLQTSDKNNFASVDIECV